jgi:hypothetical protein
MMSFVRDELKRVANVDKIRTHGQDSHFADTRNLLGPEAGANPPEIG